MQHIRRSILLLVSMLAMFFNIERLDFGQDNIIDISTFVYVLTLIAVMATLLIPRLGQLRTLPLVALWTLGYVSMRLLAGVERPIIGGLYTYLTLTELAG